MAAQPAPERHLRVVDAVTTTDGEVLTSKDVTALQAEVEKLRVNLKMAERDVRAKNRRIAELERDKALERLEHPQRELIERIATYWHRKIHPDDYARAKPRINPLSPARFDAVAGLVEMTRVVWAEVNGKRQRTTEPFYEPEAFKEAIDGAAFDCWKKQRKNGSWEFFNDLELITRDSKHLEAHRARAPKRDSEGC